MAEYIIVNGELYHHGIKGMRWGVRRFQKKDGTLTSAGKKRYDDAGDKSKHRLKLEEKYRKKGMSQRDAEAAADRRIKTEKVIAITAGMTVAAASAYVVGKQIRDRTDRIVKSGTTFQRISNDETAYLDRAMYTSYKKTDNMKYRGLYGHQLATAKNTPNKISLKATSDIKVASRKSASDTFANLYKNDVDFRTAFNKHINDLDAGGAKYDPRYTKLYKNLKVGMSEKKLKTIGYDAFNRQLTGHDENTNVMAKKFYDQMKRQGYDAVIDINDKKYSGFKTKAPTIVFNAKEKMTLSTVEKLTEDQIMSDVKKAMGMNMAPQLAKAGALYVGTPIVAKKTIKAIRVNNYKIEHPNTKLTDAEILEVLSKQ